MNEEYEKIEFKTWQELAKFVIDGRDIYHKIENEYKKVDFDFGYILNFACFTKRQKTIEEFIKIKPRLCKVDCYYTRYTRVVNRISDDQNYKFIDVDGTMWKHAEMLTDEEIKEFLNDK